MTFRLLDVVVLDRDLPSDGLRRGDLATVVEVHDDQHLELEFITASGKTKALVTASARDVRPARADDLVSVRRTA
ncbi:MAG: DUF4926 domain-containing protein [Acidobacteriota bacterium]